MGACPRARLAVLANSWGDESTILAVYKPSLGVLASKALLSTLGINVGKCPNFSDPLSLPLETIENQAFRSVGRLKYNVCW